MCGIVARSGKTNSTPLFSLPHRGPDQEYRGNHGDLQVVFNRLTITGGDFGSAPVTSSDGRWTVFLNGEIYNFKELVTNFFLDPSPSDTVVLASGLQKLGFKIFDYLAGMFSVLIIDNLEKKEFVARDPLGEKPLFYSFHRDEVLISSEFRSLKRYLGGELNLNPVSISDYFRFGYIEGPKTIDKRISEFPRGTLVQIQKNQISKVKSIPEKRDFDYLHLDLHEIVSHVRSEVMSTEVEYAVMLSGGFDSSSLIKQAKMKEGYAFTLASGKKVNVSEVKLASRAARAAKLEHLLVSLKERDLIEGLKGVAESIDQPHSDMASLGYYRLFQAMQEFGIKVAVSGIGFDELFWGYKWFNSHLISINDNFEGRIFWDTPQKLPKLLDLCAGQRTIQESIPNDPYLSAQSKYQRARAEMVHSYLSVNGLGQLDRLSMKFSIEARSPYSDFRLYLWAQSNSNSRRDFEKKTLKKALSPSLFSIARWRKKQGFDLGMMEFLNLPLINNSVMKDLNCLDERKVLPFNITSIGRLSTRERYRLLMLEYWLRGFNY